MEAFMEANGHPKGLYKNVVGLRADEAHRVARATVRGDITPLSTLGVTKRIVLKWWAKQNFDLQLLPFEGNCDGCFLKARPKLWEIERTAPGTLEWWAQIEEGPGKGRFVTEYSYRELMRDVRTQPDLFAGGLFDFDPDMDAECGLWCEEAA